MLAQRLAALNVAASSSGPTSPARLLMDAEQREAASELQSVATKVNNRATNIRLEDPKIFWIGSFFIFAIEAYLNKIIVDMAAQTTGGMSLLVAALVSIALVTLAHLCGSFLRQVWSESEDRILFVNAVLGLFLLVVVAVAVLAIMALRAYFALMTTTSNLHVFSDAVDALKELGLDFVFRSFAVPESVTLGGLNILALLVAFLFGFLSHDSDHQYDSRIREDKAVKEKLRRTMKAYEARLEKIFNRFRYKVEMAQKAFVSNKGVLSDLPEDNFKAQRAQAERAVAAGTPAESTPPPHTPAVPPAANVTVMSPKTSSGNPW